MWQVNTVGKQRCFENGGLSSTVLTKLFVPSRQGRKETNFYFLRTWRALRLCSSPCGVLALVEKIQLGRVVTPRGESSFPGFRDPKSNEKFKFG